MTLKNAKRRFESVGWEVERHRAPHQVRVEYKARKAGTLAWQRSTSLEYLLKVAGYGST